MKSLFSSLFLTLAALLMAACGPKEDPVVAVSGVSLNQTSVTLSVGGSVSLTATVSPSDATDKTVTWASSNPSSVTVENGLVKAVSPGTASVTATAGGKSAKCDVTVQIPGSNEDYGYKDLK